MTFAAAERVADAVLYEGYVLYPYRASAPKNRFRWQFGVVAPPAYAAADPSETAVVRTECLVEGARPTLDVRVRFLRIEARTVEVPCDSDPGRFERVLTHRVGARELVTWDAGLPTVVDLTGLSVPDLLHGSRVAHVSLPALRTVETVRDDDGVVRARIVRERWPIVARVCVTGDAAPPYVRVSVQVENLSDSADGRPPADRDEALRQSCASAHVLLAVNGGAFVSLMDPPPGAAAAAAACVNDRLWPVLMGPPGSRGLVLASPIILSDYPHVAPESPGDLCDATEIDEILSLRIMTLTDEEKGEACATDDRARRIVERTDTLPPEVFERLHGAIRQLDTESFFNPPDGVPLGDGIVQIGRAEVRRGSRVRLQPSRRADTMDMFLAGRAATVAGVYRDVEDRAYVAVTIDDDPGADIQKRAGRFFYFYPEELEPLGPAAVHGDGGRGLRQRAARAGAGE